MSVNVKHSPHLFHQQMELPSDKQRIALEAVATSLIVFVKTWLLRIDPHSRMTLSLPRRPPTLGSYSVCVPAHSKIICTHWGSELADTSHIVLHQLSSSVMPA